MSLFELGSNQQTPLLAFAAEQEREAFLQRAEGCGHGLEVLARRSTAAARAAASKLVILVGAGRAGEVRRWVCRNKLSVGLLVSLDRRILEFPDLLGRCMSVVAAPYTSTQLASFLSSLHGSPDADPFAAGVLEMNIVGESPRIRQMLRMVNTFSRYEAPVLLCGETGTGKEMVARGIHYGSPRCDDSFVPVNCCALSDELLVAELFGYERGAFTDAKRAHTGLVAQANGGTLFLDEVDSLSSKAQGALLRFLQDQEYRPLGSKDVMRADVRVISATNKDLEHLVEQERFREDLYYRLHILHVELPPLRKRAGDIVILAEHFLEQFCKRYNGVRKALHPLTVRWMERYNWPGNVRELENYLHRAFVLSSGHSICAPMEKGDPIQLAAWQESSSENQRRVRVYQEEKLRVVEQFEREYVERVLAETGGNISQAARRAGKERRALGRLIKKHGIDRRSYTKQ